ncbi:hypothetical protein EJ06DRAFT_364605 [Trichodelitschia bisporula]|uniref:Uncharacterized protein n=1 Tax=Trichodelitschia bisporula TaxID=703511 RepID=A0A6G1I101_9PEZI|nr:hypothetical protein EJ06DRAFT_364605 [Trichodelitschia bisporula]
MKAILGQCTARNLPKSNKGLSTVHWHGNFFVTHFLLSGRRSKYSSPYDFSISIGYPRWVAQKRPHSSILSAYSIYRCTISTALFQSLTVSPSSSSGLSQRRPLRELQHQPGPFLSASTRIGYTPVAGNYNRPSVQAELPYGSRGQCWRLASITAPLYRPAGVPTEQFQPSGTRGPLFPPAVVDYVPTHFPSAVIASPVNPRAQAEPTKLRGVRTTCWRVISSNPKAPSEVLNACDDTLFRSALACLQ